MVFRIERDVFDAVVALAAVVGRPHELASVGRELGDEAILFAGVEGLHRAAGKREVARDGAPADHRTAGGVERHAVTDVVAVTAQEGAPQKLGAVRAQLRDESVGRVVVHRIERSRGGGEVGGEGIPRHDRSIVRVERDRVAVVEVARRAAKHGAPDQISGGIELREEDVAESVVRLVVRADRGREVGRDGEADHERVALRVDGRPPRDLVTRTADEGAPAKARGFVRRGVAAAFASLTDRIGAAESEGGVQRVRSVADQAHAREIGARRAHDSRFELSIDDAVLDVDAGPDVVMDQLAIRRDVGTPTRALGAEQEVPRFGQRLARLDPRRRTRVDVAREDGVARPRARGHDAPTARSRRLLRQRVTIVEHDTARREKEGCARSLEAVARLRVELAGVFDEARRPRDTRQDQRKNREPHAERSLGQAQSAGERGRKCTKSCTHACLLWVR